ncbi:MAG: M23 family metallopeptidase [Desulfobacterales bacterium]|nr:M23 family metallopeptidase [Desulfobacterales bacterium]
MKEKTKSKKRGFLIIAGLVVLFPISWFLLVRYEGQNPDVVFELTSPYVGKSQDFSISVADSKSGLRKVWLAMVKDGKEVVLVDTEFPSAGILSGGKLKTKTLSIPFEPAKHQLSDGKAILRLAVWDYSWRGWWKGNRVYVEKNLIIDTQPPVIEVLSTVHNLTQGGSGLVIFRTSEDSYRSGVQVGNNFFPAHAGYYTDDRIQTAYIGLGYQQGPETRIFVKAFDEAGNSAEAGINLYIRKKTFKKDSIRISNNFLNRKMPEFKAVAALPPTGSPVEKFVRINRDLRQANYQQLTELVQTTAAVKHWQGAFKRMTGSANQAGFADHRVYTYNGKIIDRQVHLGIDLASVSHAPVPAANSGVVIFSGDLGIYGKTVLIDHGFGLFSMYAHLSGSDVRKGQQVSKGDTLGRTGSTGLAGGDHLHFSMLVHNTFVNPIEWWDAAWIKNNVTSKIEAVPSIPKKP